MASDPIPLVVDLDGTLIDCDTLHLSLARLVLRQPWAIPRLLLAVRGGRARFKRFVSDRVALDPATLPYRSEVVAFIRRERASGRKVVLGTAADERIADAVARHLGLFDAVVASDGRHNAKGPAKVAAIRARLGTSEFDYVGDSHADVPVFCAARRCYLVGGSQSLARLVLDARAADSVFVGVPAGPLSDPP